MKKHTVNPDDRTAAQATPPHPSEPRRRFQTGLAVAGPGFLVWDEVASDARRRAAELAAVAPWGIRPGAR